MSISVIIKTLNEAKRLAATLESVLAAIGPEDEVIVADSGSTDGTQQIALGYPVTLVEAGPGQMPSCGLGPQLGYQHSRGDYICLMDGDMLLDGQFLQRAVAFLQANPGMAGVTGRIVEMNMESLEFARRARRGGVEVDVGPVNRLNGGGLFRRAAIESVGYFSDPNLHSYEEFELGLRLRQQGWTLQRLDIVFVQHFGHEANVYALLARRWRSKYLFGAGEVLRGALGQPHWPRVLGELRELRLWALVYLWWGAALAMLLLLPDKRMALGLVLAGFVLAVAVLSIRKRSLSMGLYSVIAWFFHAAALPVGLLRQRRDPALPIPSSVSRPADRSGPSPDAMHQAGLNA
jgi:glycosyltransferase involved in cell wall biosynthesis